MSTVIICCKEPSGFIMEVQGKSVKINGYNSEDGFIMFERGQKIGITHDVDESFFDAWLLAHKDHPLNTGGFVFKSKSEKSAKDEAKEKKDEKTGMEQKTEAELDKVAGATKNKGD